MSRSKKLYETTNWRQVPGAGRNYEICDQGLVRRKDVWTGEVQCYLVPLRNGSHVFYNLTINGRTKSFDVVSLLRAIKSDFTPDYIWVDRMRPKVEALNAAIRARRKKARGGSHCPGYREPGETRRRRNVPKDPWDNGTLSGTASQIVDPNLGF